MAIKLMYITNNEAVAKIAEDSGVDWIFVDLEIIGKTERQGHLDTVISKHEVSDVARIKSVLNKADLLVRVNPINCRSEIEINEVVESGCDIIMLPFFRTKDEVETFIELVNGRAQTCLLVETPEAVRDIDSILAIEGVDFVHIGLNDLSLGYGMKFIFEPLVDGTVERLCTKLRQKGIPYGFGGIARLWHGLLPAEIILAEHYRLGSSAAILSRSFCDMKRVANPEQIRDLFRVGVQEIRDFELWLTAQSEGFYDSNAAVLHKKIKEIVSTIQ